MVNSRRNTILEVSHLSCVLNKKKVLRDISFKVSVGEFISIIGPNGSGKSTLLRHIIRMHRSPDNTITLENKDLNLYPQKEIAMKIALVPQSEPTNMDYTVLQFILMGLYPKRNPLVRYSKYEIDYSVSVLRDFDLIDYGDRKMSNISGGERQKIFIAAALMQKPTILLLDEPTTFLDPQHQNEIHNLLSNLNKNQNMTIITVTHDINFVSHFSQRVIALKSGMLIFNEPVESFMSTKKIEIVFDTRFELIHHETTGKIYAFPVEHAQKTLFNHLNFLKRIFDFMPNPVFYQDSTGTIQGANRSFYSFFNIHYNKDERKSINDCLPRDIICALNENNRGYSVDQAVYSYEKKIVKENNQEQYLLVKKTIYFDQKGEIEGLLGVVDDISSQRKHINELETRAFNDGLTGLPNRDSFVVELNKAISEARKNSLYLALLFIDLDGFKNVNDSLGHDAGDQVLVSIAGRIKKCIRKNDLSSRFGGDEFAVFLRNLNDLSTANIIANRILQEVSKPVSVTSATCNVGASIGISIFPDDSEYMDVLIKNADTAMYQVKNTGKNNFLFYNSLSSCR